LRKLERLVEENCQTLIEAYIAFHGQ
jgi:hypothetical protein